MTRFTLFLILAALACAPPPSSEVSELREELSRLVENRKRPDPREPDYCRNVKRGDRISEIKALLRFHGQMGRLPGEQDDLTEFDAKLVMRALESRLSNSIERIEAYRAGHGHYPAALADLGGKLDGTCVDLGFEPLYGRQAPTLLYWPPLEGRGYVFGVRMRCSAWFGLAPNMWTLDFLICPTDLRVHPEWDGFTKYYTRGRWAVWYSNV